MSEFLCERDCMLCERDIVWCFVFYSYCAIVLHLNTEIRSAHALSYRSLLTVVTIFKTPAELARQGAEAVFSGAMQSAQQNQSRPTSSGYSKVSSDPNYASV